MSFRTAEPALKDVLDGIASGQIQLPDFQRGWVWDDNHIRSLIASLSLSYPIGAVMFLEAGGVPFKPRLFAGHRVGAHHRVQQRRVFRNRLQPAPMLLFGFAVFILLERFTKIMLRPQAA